MFVRPTFTTTNCMPGDGRLNRSAAASVAFAFSSAWLTLTVQLLLTPRAAPIGAGSWADQPALGAAALVGDAMVDPAPELSVAALGATGHDEQHQGRRQQQSHQIRRPIVPAHGRGC